MRERPKLMSCNASSSVSKGVKESTSRNERGTTERRLDQGRPSLERRGSHDPPEAQAVRRHARRSRRDREARLIPCDGEPLTQRVKGGRVLSVQRVVSRSHDSEASRGIRRQELRARSRSSALAKSLSCPCLRARERRMVRWIGSRPRS